MNNRPKEISEKFVQIIEDNLQDLISGKADDYLDIHTIASMMNIHATHLSNTIKDTTGKSPCDICNEKTIELAKALLSTDISISSIAYKLTYEPTNFTKYFKRHTGMTPSIYRDGLLKENT